MAPGLSNAQLTVCNTTNDEVSVALYSNVTEGWWGLKSKECKQLLKSLTAGTGVGLYTKPATRVKGISDLESGAILSWCARDEKFLLKPEDMRIGCPVGYYEAGFKVYDVKWKNITWNLEVDPNLHSRTTTGRGAPIGRGERIPSAQSVGPLVPKPNWIAITSTTQHTLTSRGSRKDHTWKLGSDSGFYTCTYRVREKSSVGTTNHYHLNNAYASEATLLMSVRSANIIDVGNGWAEISQGDRASLDVEIDWYAVYVPQKLKWTDVRQQLNEILSKGQAFLEAAENAPIREAFRGSTWPADIRCGDRPSTYNREQDSQPAPMPNFQQSATQVAATGDINCLENGQQPNFRITSRSSQAGADCAQAKAAVENYFFQRDRCTYASDAVYPNRIWDRGPINWIQTGTCK